MGGELPQSELARINAHLDACKDCRQLAAALAAVETPTKDGAQPRTAPHERPAALPPSALVGRYFVLELIGFGAMGTVYSAFDPQLERKVALKLLRPDTITEEAR